MTIKLGIIGTGGMANAQAKAFAEITGIKVIHHMLPEGDVVERGALAHRAVHDVSVHIRQILPVALVIPVGRRARVCALASAGRSRCARKLR